MNDDDTSFSYTATWRVTLARLYSCTLAHCLHCLLARVASSGRGLHSLTIKTSRPTQKVAKLTYNTELDVSALFSYFVLLVKIRTKTCSAHPLALTSPS